MIVFNGLLAHINRQHQNRSLRIAILVTLAGTGLAMQRVSAQTAYSPGKLAVLVVGNGSGSLSSSATPVFVKEFNITGAAQTGVIRTTLLSTENNFTGSVDRALTQSGTGTSEGHIALSANRQLLVIAGYNASAGDPSVSASTIIFPPTNSRVIGSINASGVADTKTTLGVLSSGSAIRSAASVDGSAFWSAGASGIFYGLDGSSGSTLSSTNSRVISIFNNQLYTSSQSGSIRLATVGSGLPTSGSPAITNLSGFLTTTGDPYSHVFIDLNGGGPDIVYVASLSTIPSGLLKYTSADNGATWVSRGSLSGNVFGVTGVFNSCTGNVDLYITANTVNAKPNALYKFSDLSVTIAAPAAISSVGSALSAVGTLLATAAANTAFGGVAFTPNTTFTVPAIYNVTGGNACTPTTIQIGLEHSEKGVSYQLYNGASPVGSPVLGTSASGGTAISFGSQSAVGTYTVVATNLLTGCTATMTGTSIINATPTVSFTGLSTSYCINAVPATLTANYSGGNFSGSGITDNGNGTAIFNPATAGVGGPYTITYSNSSNGCNNIATHTVTVNALPLVNFSGLSATYCLNNATVTLTGSPAGGVFSGRIVNGNQFDPAGAGVGGPYTITYDYTNPATGCSNSASQPVTVYAVPAISGITPATRCGAGSLTLAATGSGSSINWYAAPGGGSPIATGNSFVTGNITSTTNFYATAVGAGGCESPRTMVTATVTVAPSINVSATNLTVCSGSPTQLSVSSSNDPNYTYTWTSVPAGFTATGSGPHTVNPTVGTTYQVMAHDNTIGNSNSGCTNNGSVTINTFVSSNSIVLVASATPSTVCIGGSSQLNALASYRYNMNANCGVSFINISGTGNSISGLGDDTQHSLAIPAFNFQGASYSSIVISSNGLIALGSSGSSAFANTLLPTSTTITGNVFLAPYWDDLRPKAGTGIFTQTIGSLFIIQYTNFDHFSTLAENGITFQVQLNLSTGVISFVYQDVFFGNGTLDAGIGATVGIQSSTEEAVQYSFNTASLVNGQSICFTPTASNFNYDWSTNPTYLSAVNINNPVATAVMSSQIYTVTAIDQSNGCIKSKQVYLGVSADPVPVITQVAACGTSAAVQLMATIPPGTGTISSYQWFFNGNSIPASNSATYNATATGNYSVTAVNSFGCVGTSAAFNLSSIPGALSGAYTIDEGDPASCTNYVSFAAAITDLNTKGVAGHVIFNVANGHTETAPAGGLVINYCGLNPSLKPSAIQTVTFQGGSSVMITAPVGVSTSTDGIVKLVGADYITFDNIDLQESVTNTTALERMEWGYALLKCNGNDGSNHNTITNCRITLDRLYIASTGIYSGNHSATSLTEFNYTGSTIDPGLIDNSRNGSNRFVRNTIQSVHKAGISLNGNSTVSQPYSLNDTLNVIGGTNEGNSIVDFGGGPTNSVDAIGIYVVNQRNITIVDNTITSGLGGGANSKGAMGINMQSGMSAVVKDNIINLATTSPTAGIIGITCDLVGGSAIDPNIVTITGNTIEGISYTDATTGALSGILSSSAGTGSIVSINNNTIQNNTISGTGTITGIANTGNPGTLFMNENTVTGNSRSGHGNMILLDAGDAGIINMNANQVTENEFLSCNGIMYCSRAGTGQLTFESNNVSDNLIAGTSANGITSGIYGYYNNGSPNSENIQNNTIANLTITGSSPGSTHLLYGIYTSSAVNDVKNISGNLIHSFAMSIAGNVHGIHTAMGTANIFKNKIYNINSSSTNALTNVSGILLESGNLLKVYNNFIGNLRATATSSSDAVRGIACISTTPNSSVGLYFNTIYLNSTSSGTVFGNTGIFHTANATATTAALDLRNNIVVNISTPVGTGRAVAYRRSNSALANFASTSNNNLFDVGSGSANYVYSDGFNNLGLPAYKAFAGISPRETNSQTENVNFQNTSGPNANFLKVNTSTLTYVEAGAQTISGIVDDYFGTPRHSVSPDIGAHEDNFTSLAPSISMATASPASPQCVATARTITANVIAGANPVTAVTLSYSFAGIAQPAIGMTGGPTVYSATLPAAPSPNVPVAWSVTVTDGTYSESSAGTAFTDDYLSGSTAIASVNPAVVCAGSPVQLSAVFNAAVSAAPPANTYCASTHASGCSGDEITHVTLGNINNSTSGCGGATHYSYFSGGGSQTTTLAAGISYTFSVSFGAHGTQYFGAWIDYDQDGNYEVSEFLGASGNAGSNGTTSISFNIPSTAKNGLTHIRIVGGNDAVVAATQACGASSGSYGETQDYDVTITGSEPAFALPVTYAWKDASNNIVGTAANPTTINAQTANAYTITATDANGCSLLSAPVAVSMCTGGTVTLNLKLFLQGYYIDGGIMQPVLNNQAVVNSLASETDTVTVELHDATSFALIDSRQAILQTNGNLSAVFTQPEGSYYIAIKHRSSIQTWSADPVACFVSTPLYDFTVAAIKAMGDNQVEVQPGKWAFYCGDLNQDDFIDGNDFPGYDSDSYNGVNSVYVATDLNGDGFVDGNDFPVYDLNSYYGVSSIHP